jgi:uncharacterized membrane protein
METTALESLFRWIIVAGITWIGLLYFFNFVNGPFAATIDGPTKQKVVPSSCRARSTGSAGAAWTWVTGVLLLLLVFYHGGITFEAGHGWGLGAIVMVLITFLAAALYDVIASSAPAKDLRVLAAIGFVLIGLIVLGYIGVGFSYRAYVIHTGGLLGTTMAVTCGWYLAVAAKIIGDQAGPAATRGRGALARAPPQYLHVGPLVWMMINSHTVVPFATSPVSLFVAILVGWSDLLALHQGRPGEGILRPRAGRSSSPNSYAAPRTSPPPWRSGRPRQT